MGRKASEVGGELTSCSESTDKSLRITSVSGVCWIVTPVIVFSHAGAGESGVDFSVGLSIHASSESVNSNAIATVNKSDCEISKTPRLVIDSLIEGRVKQEIECLGGVVESNDVVLSSIKPAGVSTQLGSSILTEPEVLLEDDLTISPNSEVFPIPRVNRCHSETERNCGVRSTYIEWSRSRMTLTISQEDSVGIASTLVGIELWNVSPAIDWCRVSA
mmetsp:Transcript_34019/g.39667  ORF Transcript_34019/g.39667 Transcript_34019/m.39667 type:complete len:218 (-) Transcript_34019:1749-2402(-)